MHEVKLKSEDELQEMKDYAKNYEDLNAEIQSKLDEFENWGRIFLCSSSSSRNEQLSYFIIIRRVHISSAVPYSGIKHYIKYDIIH